MSRFSEFVQSQSPSAEQSDAQTRHGGGTATATAPAGTSPDVT
ncbi:MAG: hypothetical protein JWN44_311 [Myxococcales bacterium]|nr:hypothetical protein [Myxococcales bacterium]